MIKPMTAASQEDTSRRWVLPFLAALVAVLATILSSASASAATQGVAETRVRASSIVAEVPVEPPQAVSAGERLGNEPAGVVTTVATGVAANSGSRLAEASSSAFRAADNVGGFSVSAKHLPGAGGRWNKWAEGIDINGTIANALRSDGASFLPNAGGAADTFIVRTNVGSVIGTKGQTFVKAVVANDGRIITAYPVK